MVLAWQFQFRYNHSNQRVPGTLLSLSSPWIVAKTTKIDRPSVYKGELMSSNVAPRCQSK